MDRTSEITNCRKWPDCKVKIRMLNYRRTGNDAPIEAEPSANGNIHIDLEQRTYIILTGDVLTEARNRGVELHLNHFASCPFARHFKKEASAATAK